jgi:DNA-binding NarL/FixJ family response regulator
MTRVLIADDHEMFRELLRIAAQARPEFAIVGEAGDGRGAIELAERLRPDIVLLDYRMPSEGNFEMLVRSVIGTSGSPGVIVLSGFASEDIARNAATAGARGYVLKTTRLVAVFDAVRTVASGGVWIDPGLPRKVFALFQDQTASATGQDPGIARLTRREREVLACIAQGINNREIARKLCVSEPTVKTHITRIFVKLQVDNRVAAALAFYSREAGSLDA